MICDCRFVADTGCPGVFCSLYPLHQKLGVIRSLFNRCENVVTEEEDRRQEEEHITSALKKCSYPAWGIRKAKRTSRTRVIKRGSVMQLTEHLNSVDSTGSIRFTHEEEAERQISFLDTLLIRKEDGNIKLLVYRKKTHTDQYLNFMSHHPSHQKLGVIRTLLNRCENVATEKEDRRQEEEHNTSDLKKCSYPAWSTRKANRTCRTRVTKELRKPVR